MMPETCFGLRKPTIAPVTAGFFRVRAIANCPGVRPYLFPIARRDSTRFRLRDKSGSWKLGRFLRQSSVEKSATRSLCHRSREQSGRHRGIHDDSDVGL